MNEALQTQGFLQSKSAEVAELERNRLARSNCASDGPKPLSLDGQERHGGLEKVTIPPKKVTQPLAENEGEELMQCIPLCRMMKTKSVATQATGASSIPVGSRPVLHPEERKYLGTESPDGLRSIRPIEAVSKTTKKGVRHQGEKYRSSMQVSPHHLGALTSPDKLRALSSTDIYQQLQVQTIMQKSKESASSIQGIIEQKNRQKELEQKFKNLKMPGSSSVLKKLILRNEIETDLRKSDILSQGLLVSQSSNNGKAILDLNNTTPNSRSCSSSSSSSFSSSRKGESLSPGKPRGFRHLLEPADGHRAQFRQGLSITKQSASFEPDHQVKDTTLDNNNMASKKETHSQAAHPLNTAFGSFDTTEDNYLCRLDSNDLSCGSPLILDQLLKSKKKGSGIFHHQDLMIEEEDDDNHCDEISFGDDSPQLKQEPVECYTFRNPQEERKAEDQFQGFDYTDHHLAESEHYSLGGRSPLRVRPVELAISEKPESTQNDNKLAGFSLRALDSEAESSTSTNQKIGPRRRELNFRRKLLK